MILHGNAFDKFHPKNISSGILQKEQNIDFLQKNWLKIWDGISD